MLKPLILPAHSLAHLHQSQSHRAPEARSQFHTFAFASTSASSDRDIQLLNLVSQRVKARRRHHHLPPTHPSASGWTHQKISATMAYKTSATSRVSSTACDDTTPRQESTSSFSSSRPSSSSSSAASIGSFQSLPTISKRASSSSSTLLLNIPAASTSPRSRSTSCRSRTSLCSTTASSECMSVASRAERSPKSSRKSILRSMETSPLCAAPPLPSSPVSDRCNPLMAALAPSPTRLRPAPVSTLPESPSTVAVALPASTHRVSQAIRTETPTRTSSRPINAGHRKRRSKVLVTALKKAKDARDASLSISSSSSASSSAILEPSTASREMSFDDALLFNDVGVSPSFSRMKELEEKARPCEQNSDDEDDPGWEDFISGGYLSFPLPPPKALTTISRRATNISSHSSTLSASSMGSSNTKESSIASSKSKSHSRTSSKEQRSLRRQSVRISQQISPARLGVAGLGEELAWASSDEEIDGVAVENEREGPSRHERRKDMFLTPTASPMVGPDNPRVGAAGDMSRLPPSMPLSRSPADHSQADILATEEHLARTFGIRVKRMSSLSPQRQQQPRPVPTHLRSIPPANPAPRFLQGPLPTVPTSYKTGAKSAFQGSMPSRERSNSTFSAASSSVLSSSETCSIFSKTTSPFYGDETSSVRTSSTRPSSAESQSATSKQQQAPPARPPKSPIRALADLPPPSTPVFTIEAEPSTDRALAPIATSRRTSSFSLGKLMSRSPSNSSVLSLRDKYHALGSSSTVSLATASDCPASPSLCADNSSHVRRSSSFRLSQKLRSKLAFKPTSPSSSMHCPPTPDDVPITPTSSDSLNIKTSFGAQQQRSFSSRIKSFHPHLGDADDAHSFLPTLGKKEAMLFHLIPSPPPTASSGSFTSSPPL